MAAPTDDRSTALGVIALVTLLLAGYAIIPRLFHRTHADESAPDFTLAVIANAGALPPAPSASATTPAPQPPTLSLHDLQGKPVLLDFWASWCGPCREETPIVNKVAARFKDRGLVTVGVNTGDEEPSARAWAMQNGISFPIVFDRVNAAAKAYNVDNLPTLVLVSKTGKILAVHTGLTDDGELEHLVTQAL
jgi:thiol-disulfide isomerase/thioredoxin